MGISQRSSQRALHSIDRSCCTSARLLLVRTKRHRRPPQPQAGSLRQCQNWICCRGTTLEVRKASRHLLCPQEMLWHLQHSQVNPEDAIIPLS